MEGSAACGCLCFIASLEGRELHLVKFIYIYVHLQYDSSLWQY